MSLVFGFLTILFEKSQPGDLTYRSGGSKEAGPDKAEDPENREKRVKTRPLCPCFTLPNFPIFPAESGGAPFRKVSLPHDRLDRVPV